MKLQDQYPFDPTFTAPYIIFKKVGSSEFYVNSDCILANQKIITVGKEYMVIDNTKDSGIEMRNVVLAGCNYRKGIIHLIVREICSQRLFNFDHCILPPERDNNFVLIDPEYVSDRKNIEAINSYCATCNDSKKKYFNGIRHKSNPDDLLEFEF